MMRKPVIKVVGGSKADAEVCAQAKQLGSLIAQRGWVLLNGGRNQEVMATSAEGAKQAGRIEIFIFPDRSMSKAVLESAPCSVLMVPVATMAQLDEAQGSLGAVDAGEPIR